jgi:carbon-monoxide dehydrogenase medium subunit
MNPPRFEYYAPTGIEEIVGLLKKYGDDAKILAGGQSLLPLLKSRVVTIPCLISLSEVRGLSYIDERKDGVHVGAMTVDSDLEFSDIIKKHFPLIQDCASQVADPLVRNTGTIGGNISHADPSNDFPSVMLAIGAKFVVQGESGTREISAEDFFVDTFETSMKHDEVLKEIILPYWGSNSYGAYGKFKKGTWNFSVAGVAVQLSMESGKINKAGIAITSMGPKAIKCTEAEKYLAGKKPDDSVLKHAAELIVGASQPSEDQYGSEKYKKEILRRLSIKTMEKAIKMDGGN